MEIIAVTIAITGVTWLIKVKGFFNPACQDKIK
jgi:hypothetical protein